MVFSKKRVYLMEAILVTCADFAFAVRASDVFRILLKHEIQCSNGSILYQDYTFQNLTNEFQKLIQRSYPDEYYILFSNPETQASLSVEKINEAIAINTTELYPISEDLYENNQCIFKYFYYNTDKKQGALLFDFQQLLIRR
jgi:hypothetical protein